MGLTTFVVGIIIVVVAIVWPALYLVRNHQENSGGILDENLRNEDHVTVPEETPRQRNTQRPHIIFIMLDDAGFNDVSWNNPEVYMPTIDKLARKGIILDQHYSQHVCTPSRTAFLTGMYPFHSGDQHSVALPWSPACNARFHRLLPDKLRDIGYRTYAFGKWHLGYCHVACTPTERGFDSFAGYHNGMIDHYNLTIYSRLDWYDNATLNRKDPGTYSTDLITQRTVQGIEDHDPHTPGFFYINYAAPHNPIQVPDHYVTRFPTSIPDLRRRYLGMLYSIDESVKMVVEKLKEKKMWESSVLILLSDNGGEFAGIPTSSSNAPLRGAKLSLYEGGTRTPAFILAPSMMQTGMKTHGMFHITDWHSTILALTGAPPEHLDGLDQTEMLLRGGVSRRTEFVYNIDLEDNCYLGQSAIRQGDYKLILGYPGFVDGWEQDDTIGVAFLSNILLADAQTTGESRPASNHLGELDYVSLLYDFKAKEYVAKLKDHVQLFNLKDDPEERHNIAEEHPTRAAELRTRLEELYREYVPPHPDITKLDPASKFDQPGDAWDVGWCPPPW